MNILCTAAILCGIAGMTAACAEPPVKPIPDASRKDVAAISGDLQGVKISDTSKLGARGSSEGGRLGAAQGAATMARGGSVLALLMMPVGAMVGAAKGSAEAHSETEVDETRSTLRVALQEMDFTELLRSRLAASEVPDAPRIIDITTGSATAPLVGTDGTPVQHKIALEYRLTLYGTGSVNPQIGVFVNITALVQSADRKQMVHKATWSYCGERMDFVQIAADNAAVLRAQIANAAAVLAEAIPYDLYVSREPRRLSIRGACMDFTNLPSGIGWLPGPTRS
jgi:hypothetical protein